MRPYSMMRHRVDIWRPTLSQGTLTAQTPESYTQVYSSVPCFIQPASSQLQFAYAQRGTTVTHTVYTVDTTKTFQREDIVEFGGRQFHLVADPISGLESDVYLQLICEEYPEGFKKRLDRQEYE
jgi:hypothetical protein